MLLSWILLLGISHIKISSGNPLFSPDFEDNWNYELVPNEEPLITKQNSHPDYQKLSFADKREGKEAFAEDDLNYIETQNFQSDELKESGNAIREKIPCSVCRLGVGILQGDVKRGKSFKAIKNKFVSLCLAFQLQTSEVCNGIFDVFGPQVLTSFNYTKLDSAEICLTILGESCEEIDNPSLQWNIELPDVPKPPAESLPEPNKDLPYMKVLQISDTHFDPNYMEGSPSNCKEPLCCRSSSTVISKGKPIPAGKWGSFGKCDVPLRLIENMFENIVLNHPDIDYIIWTGDLLPHDIWNQNRTQVVENLRTHVEILQKYFPSIPIFPVLGNHEAVPAGSFPPPWVIDRNFSIQWLYEEAEKQWRNWLPPSSNITIQHGGFYSVLIKPGFRLISINTNYCNSISWWLLLNNTDPAKELKWLVHELQEAENKNEKVHIIGHIPPGDVDCLKEWSRNYNVIINRYEATVKAQFFGHSHGDEFEVFYDDETQSIPTNVAYVSPSVTTFGDHNPAFRIYYVDGFHDIATWEILNHETWTTNLEEANNDGTKPLWYKLYSAKEAYNMNSLRPVEWDNLIQKMTDDPVLFGQFYRYYFRDSKKRPFCNLVCKIQILCDLKSGRSHNRKKLCEDLEMKILSKVLPNNSSFDSKK